ncbi:hypothetical protein EVAR_60551_1 [Eumeta japonica]|uniref:Uncharacterized protein n=1 Tax=Eumeta variegata TaxID=151549 RepID=A0A4C1YHW5_EUMVA|nr:hypothetical protein EVAR_60551_1 [Eumeta japonica]
MAAPPVFRTLNECKDSGSVRSRGISTYYDYYGDRPRRPGGATLWERGRGIRVVVGQLVALGRRCRPAAWSRSEAILLPEYSFRRPILLFILLRHYIGVPSVPRVDAGRSRSLFVSCRLSCRGPSSSGAVPALHLHRTVCARSRDEARPASDYVFLGVKGDTSALLATWIVIGYLMEGATWKGRGSPELTGLIITAEAVTSHLYSLTFEAVLTCAEPLFTNTLPSLATADSARAAPVFVFARSLMPDVHEQLALDSFGMSNRFSDRH